MANENPIVAEASMNDNLEETKGSNDERELYITTKDNPYDPQTQFDEWYAFDVSLGYNTTQRLAKTIEYVQDEMKTDDEDLLYEAAILEMIRLDPLKVYTIVARKRKDYGVVHIKDGDINILKVAEEL